MSRSATISSLIAVVLLAVGLYANTLANGFIGQDSEVVLTNAAVQQFDLGSIFGTPSWWGRFHNGYRPLVTLSYAVNYAASGPRAVAYHATNIGLHALVGVLVFLLLRRLSGAGWPALLAALLFVAHPIATEAVAAVFGRAELLSALAALTAVYADVLSYDVQGSRRLVARGVTVAALAVALLSSESAVGLVLLLAVTDWWFRCARSGSKFVGGLRGSRGLLYGAALLVLTGCVGWRLHVEGTMLPMSAAMNPLIEESVGVRLINAFAIAGRYLSLLLLPLHLSADYMVGTLPVPYTLWSWQVLGGMAAVLACIALAVAGARRAPLLAWGVLFLACTYGPVANVAFPTQELMAERWMYLPAVGFCAAVVFGVVALLRAVELPALKAVAASLAAIVLVGYGVRTVIRNRDWRDQERLWRATVEVFPSSFEASAGLGHMDLEQRRYPEAISHLEAAVSVYQRDPAVYRELGMASEALGDVDRATKAYEMAIALAPDAIPPRRRLAAIYTRQKDYAAAVGQLRAVADRIPEKARAWADLAEVYYLDHNIGSAEDFFEKAAKLNPNLPKAYAGLAACARAQDDYDAAANDYLKALSLGAPPTPQLRDAIVELLQAIARLGPVSAKSAARVAQEALRYFPNSPDLQKLAQETSS